MKSSAVFSGQDKAPAVPWFYEEVLRSRGTPASFGPGLRVSCALPKSYLAEHGDCPRRALGSGVCAHM